MSDRTCLDCGDDIEDYHISPEANVCLPCWADNLSDDDKIAAARLLAAELMAEP